VYKYGLLSPISNARLVDDAIHLGHVFYNKLIEIERERRAGYRLERANRFPSLAVLEQEIATFTEQIKMVRTEINAHKIAGRTREVLKPLATKVKELQLVRKSTHGKFVELRSDCKLDEDFAAWSAAHDAAYNEKVKTARNACGVSWGTYNAIAASVRQASNSSVMDPTFKPWSGEGRIAVQIQGGMSVKEMATDTQLQLVMPDFSGELTRGEWRRRSRTIVKIRMGSDESRKPIWAEFPAIIHRPLPDDARIMGATITRRRLGIYRRWCYELCISCESSKFDATEPSKTQQGVATINFGWRQFNDGLRVAMVNNAVAGLEEIRLPIAITSRFSKCDDLRSIIDKQFNVARDYLVAWLKLYESSIPEWLVESLKFLPQWRQPERLDRVVGNWSRLRFAGDEAAFPMLAAWREKWRHLADWMMRNRRRGLNMRRDFYRTTAARLARTTTRLVIEAFDVSQVKRLPLPEEKNEGGSKARHNGTLAAVGELRGFLLQAAAKYHCAVDFVSAEHNTKRCNACGKLLDWDPAKKVERDCPDCSIWDQDVNATKNALDRAASGEAVTLVAPAEVAENGEIFPSTRYPFSTARAALDKRL
jgi:phage FluMu protein Com